MLEGNYGKTGFHVNTHTSNPCIPCLLRKSASLSPPLRSMLNTASANISGKTNCPGR